MKGQQLAYAVVLGQRDSRHSFFAPYSPTKNNNPRFLVHQEFRKSAKKSIQPLDSPFGGDNMSAWEREADSIATEEVTCESDSLSINCHAYCHEVWAIQTNNKLFNLFRQEQSHLHTFLLFC